MNTRDANSGYGEFRDVFEAVNSKDYDLIAKVLRDTDPKSVVDRSGATLLMYSIFNIFAEGGGDLHMVKYLIEHGVPVNATNKKQKWTALHYAASQKRADIITTLVDHGADVDARDRFGNTPLARSLNPGPLDYDTIAVLIAAGSDSSAKNNAGRSPMDFARMTNNQRLEAELKAT